MNLAATLDTAQAGDLHGRLLACEAPITADARDVRVLGQACLQVLLAHMQAGRLSIANPSEPFVEQWNLAAAAPLTSE